MYAVSIPARDFELTWGFKYSMTFPVLKAVSEEEADLDADMDR